MLSSPFLNTRPTSSRILSRDLRVGPTGADAHAVGKCGNDFNLLVDWKNVHRPDLNAGPANRAPLESGTPQDYIRDGHGAGRDPCVLIEVGAVTSGVGPT